MARNGSQRTWALVATAAVLSLAGSALAAQQWVASARAAAEAAEEQLDDTTVVVAFDLAAFAAGTAQDDAVDRAADAAAAREAAAQVAGTVLGSGIAVSERVPAFTILQATVPEEGWEKLAADWALGGDELRRLNPDVSLDRLRPGDELVVYRFDPAHPSVSRGRANYGRLYNGAPMPPGDAWIVRRESHAYGTLDAVSHLVRGLSHVAETLPGAPRPMIGDVSARYGGRLRPHRSHQSGRDADVAYYLRNPSDSESFTVARRDTLDIERQWALFRYWIERGLVEYVFVDRRFIPLMRQHAVAMGDDPEVIAWAFGDADARIHPIIRTSPGHDDHFHVRFICAAADARCR